MQTLGERLQEARQRLGVTLREAAEFTKIRTDYLQSMEANQFESIPLADVYKRGFVKVYAKYLRLDDEKAGADFNTHHSAKASRRPLEAGADEDAAFEPEAAGAPLTISRDTLIYGIIGIAAVAILLAFFLEARRRRPGDLSLRLPRSSRRSRRRAVLTRSRSGPSRPASSIRSSNSTPVRSRAAACCRPATSRWSST